MPCGNGRIQRDFRALVLVLFLTGCGPAGPHRDADGGPRPANAPSAGPCTVRETSRQRLLLEDGRIAYVEPAVLRGSTSGAYLLAGRHNYQFARSRGGRWSVVRGDSLLGAVVPPAGRARAVLAPFPSARLNGVRAVEVGAGRWAIVFAEVPDSGEEIRPDSAVRLWYGVHDGRRWTRLEPLPMPARGTLQPAAASSLVRQGSGLAWAMTLSIPRERSQIVVYELRDGRWSYEQVPTSHAQVELAYADSLGLLLAVVQPDPALRSDSNSLLLWARRPGWQIVRRVVHGSRERVFRPSLRFTPAGAVLTWIAAVPQANGGHAWEAHAMQGPVATGEPPVVVLDRVPGPLASPVSLELPGNRRFFLLDHVLEGGGATRRDIRFLHTVGDVSTAAGSIPNPYVTAFAAEAASPSEVLIAGGVLDSARQVVSSLLLQVRVSCGRQVE